jgi:hypothetical protein
MSKEGTGDANARVSKAVQLLVDVSGIDTVYADIYLRRARELLSGVLPVAQYNALKGIQRSIDAAVQESKAATMARDWQRAQTIAAQVEGLRRDAQKKEALREVASSVYEPYGVSIDPFSPGFESLPGMDPDPAALRNVLVENLKALAGADAPHAAFYDSRRAFFADLTLLSKREAANTPAVTDIRELEQLAAQAAQQGDMARLQQYAQELSARQAKEADAGAAKPETAAAVDRATYQCPVDLTQSFSDDVAKRAQALGLAFARTEPVQQAAPLFDYVLAHIWQPALSGAETEREGTMRTEAVVEQAGLPKEVSEPVKVLIGQFLRNPFANSGGARYFPKFNVEEVLLEDFPEDQEAPAKSELLSALGLSHRRGLARLEIDDALRENGATIVEKQLGLDPMEFRLVCIPHDLYMRIGRDRGWGQQQQWTHFDGYQVLKNGGLRALVGGDVRHGGLSDLVSIAITDQRECVVARFAVIRRARQVARWH